MSFMAGYLLGLGEGGGNIQPLSVTENGPYNAADYGCDGFDPVVVNVTAAVKSITITKNGTYTPPAGYDGFNPVVVKNPYETLYKLEHGGGEDIDTNIPDDEGNNIIINGDQVDNLDDLNDLINAAVINRGSVDIAVSDGNNLVKIKCELVYTTINSVKYVDPKITITNMKNGYSFSNPDTFPFYKLVAKNNPPKSAHAGITKASNMAFFTVNFGGANYQLNPSLANIGISKFDGTNDKYYILGGV